MADSDDRSDANYAFVVHTNSTASSDSPASFENSANSKQKRRRTSPRDHALLEAAYQRNSKPDKHERAEIVSKVDLGEKEVQIWFQNRRQNDRRKSKPLQPHELLAHFRNGLSAQESQTPSISKTDETCSAQSLPSASELPRPSSRSSGIRDLLNPSSTTETPCGQELNPTPTQSTAVSSTPPSSFEGTDQSVSAAKQSPTSNAYPTHSRKRSHEVMLQNSNVAISAARADAAGPAHLPKTLSRSSSFVRLAMTVDGAVRVRTNDEPTPSPPKQRTIPAAVLGRKRESLGRSQSAVEGGFVFKDVNPPIQRVGGAGFGRSRDARTWEFYCDRDSGDALSTQAEAERSGSAVGAINLIRSRSQRHKAQILSPRPTKHNTRQPQYNRVDGKPPLSRSKSSMARLESLDGTNDEVSADAKRVKHERSPSGDSDKENWQPGTRSSHHHLRRMHASASRATVLKENDFPSARPPAIMPAPQQENRKPMAREKAKGDDLDCIQGLLSLSQGAWR